QLDLAVEVVDQAEQAVEAPTCRLAQRQRGEIAAAALTEEVGVLVLDSLAGEQRVHAVLERRTHPCQHDPVAQQIAQITQLARGDVRLRKQVATEQMRKRARVNRVALHPRRAARLR